MRIVLAILGVLVVLIALVVAAPFFVPHDWLVAQVEGAVAKATGRPFAIKGDVGLSLVPTPRLTAEQISFGAGEQPLLTVGKLEAVVAAWPLLSGNIQVQRFVVSDPVATLRVDKNGQANWQQPATSEQKAPAGGQSGGETNVPEVGLGEIRIDNGVVDYADARSSLSERVEAIDLELKAKDLTGAAEVVGSALVRGEKVGLDLKVAKLRELMDKMSSPGSIAITGPIDASLDGTLSATPTGTVKVEVADPKAALDWLKVAAPSGVTMPKQVMLTGKLAAKGKTVTFDDADLKSDIVQGNGSFKFDSSGARPALSGKFATGVIDLAKLLPPPPAQAAEKTGTSPPAGGGSPAPTGSDIPLNVPTSLPIDLDLALQAQGLKSPQLTLGPTRVHAAGGAKFVLVELQEARAYNGTITGRANAAADAKGTPRLAVKLVTKGVQVGPLLKQLADQDRLDGRLSLNVDVTGDGRSVDRLLAGLDGSADVKLQAATVQGFDISAVSGNPVEIAAKLAKGGLSGGSTKIEQASASFKIANGIATTNDIVARTQPVQITGSGRLNLGERRIEQMRLLPAATKGQGGSLGNLPVVPITISGPFSSPSVSVDANAALRELAKDPKTVNKLVDQVNKLGGGKDGKQLIPKDAGKLLEGLLGRQ